jgi:hypothetical protein
MSITIWASTYGKSAREMSVCQRLTPDRKTMKSVRDLREVSWTVLVCTCSASSWMFRALISTSLFWAWFAGYATVSAMAFLPEDDLPHLEWKTLFCGF